MNMISVLTGGVIGIVAIAAIVFWSRAHQRQLTVRVRENVLFVGRDRLSISEITRIDIAPLYDVPPADDLWIFEDSRGNRISFFNRYPGVSSALPLLELALYGLNAEKALFKARDESIFEEPVNVWMAK